MGRLGRCSEAVLLVMLWSSITDASDDWPAWRGPTKNGIAAAGQKPPTHWDEKTNVIWRTKVPGRGHSSPVIVGNRIFLTSADTDSQTQSVICFKRTTGKKLWVAEVNNGGFVKKIHPNNTHASPTIVTSNNRLFAVFNNHGGVQLACLDFDGRELWKKQVGAFQPKFPFGFGSSPCIFEDTVIVMSDYPSQGFIAALKQDDGQEVWRTQRGKTSSYASPIVGEVAGKLQLIVSGSDVCGYDPITGKQLWSTEGPWQVTCGTLVWENDMVFVSGGFPTPATLGINAKTNQIVWQNQVKSYEQSLLVHEGHVYAISDRGVGYCWRSSDGKEMWKQRLAGPVSSSPVLVGDKIYATTERGKTFIIKANPDKPEIVAQNQLGDVCFATPAIVDGRIYTRIGIKENGLQEWLFCLGE